MSVRARASARPWSVPAMALALLAGCGAGSDAATPPRPVGTTAPSAAAAAPTTARPPVPTTSPTTAPAASAAVPPYSFDGSVPPPPLESTGSDFAAIFRSLDTYTHWVMAHRPDPALMEQAVSPQSSAGRGYGGLVSELVRSDLRLYDTASVVADVEVADVDMDPLLSVASLKVTYTDDRRVWVRPDGSVERTVDLPDRAQFWVLLSQRGNGQWRIMAEDPVPTGPPPAVLL